MKIHDTAAFPNPGRVRIALHEKQAFDQVEFIPVDVAGGEHKREAFRAMNPSMTVPVLELDDGTFICECTAITEYLDAAFEGVCLTGSTAQQRGVIHMMQRRAEQYVMDAVGTYFHQSSDAMGPDVSGERHKEWGLRQKQVALNGLAYFDEVLAERAYLAGESFSMADITLFMGLGFADFASVPIPDTLTHLADWRARVAARPSVLAMAA